MIWLVAFAFVLTFVIGTPIAFVLGFTGLVSIWAMGVPLQVIAQRMFTGIDSFPLMAVPFFVLAGELMNRGGTTQRIIDFAESLVGHIKGGLAHSNIIASVIFAGISGSAIADASALGSILIPSMKEKGYDLDFSAAVTAASATIGPIIPPSIIMVIYGVSVGASIGGLFAAGFIPGLMLAAAMMVVVMHEARYRHYPPVRPFSPRGVLRELKKAIWAIISPAIILGGILLGVFTPTEAASVAVVYSFLVGKFVYRELKLSDLPQVLLSSGITTAALLVIISTANVFAWAIAANMIPQRVAQVFLSISTNKYVFLAVVNAFLLMVGMFMETGAAIIILAPILAPVAAQLGVHPLHFGFMMVLNLAIGMATPPVGVCLFVTCSISGLPLEKISRAIWKFVLSEVAVLLLVSYVEFIPLFLPRLLGFIR